MIIYGTRAVTLANKDTSMLTCPNCDTTGTTDITVFSKHAHVFWIPVFSFGKTGVSLCQSCGHEIKSRKMPLEFKNEYLKIKTATRIPIWQFSGLAIIILAVLYGIYSSGETAKQNALYINEPITNDVYYYKTGIGYSTYKVTAVSADSVFVSSNVYEVDKYSGCSEINTPENYQDFSEGFSKADIKKLFEEDNIRKILRAE